MISAHSNLEVMLQNCKADAFISKPFDLSHLIAVIERELMKVS